MSLRGGIDLGGTKIQTAIVDDSGEVLGQSRRPTPTSGGPSGVADAMADALREAADSAGVEAGDLEGVGVGSPGRVDDSAGTVAGARNLPDWGGSFTCARALEKASARRSRSATTSRSRPTREFALGAGKRYDSILGVFWGTGVGGGIVLDGKPWLGRGAAGEIGHVVVSMDGARCPCGRRGCMEAYAGRGAMERAARASSHDEGQKTELFEIMEERGRDRLTSGVWARALDARRRDGDGADRRAVEALGAGVASAVNLLDVEAVIIGGGLGHPARRAVRRADPRGDAAAPVRRRATRPTCASPRSATSAAPIGASLLVKSAAAAR